MTAWLLFSLLSRVFSVVVVKVFHIQYFVVTIRYDIPH